MNKRYVKLRNTTKQKYKEELFQKVKFEIEEFWKEGVREQYVFNYIVLDKLNKRLDNIEVN